ncbi:Ig-like domain-containing protein [Rheinheimera sp. UJ51]|uniref:Ig-like domain-containing protein n=1 Tax=unclassified Rheinheimera TaxID=115860 RepID=UPI001E3B93CC|nr:MULTISPECIES: Ig-like domain-containing protein [unclassified Rheinheimera]MCC5452304.1 Ig-like domain-containing protein [Rheinheimera sp. UJ51]MCF4008922.1 Ig-like domain-containing protein [Rheinheimera sp. UJ63]
MLSKKSKLCLALSTVLLVSACNDSADKAVTPQVNTAPQAAASSITTRTDTAVTARLTAVDAEGDNLRYSSNTEPANGQVLIAIDGVFTYTPNAEFVGSDSFKFTVSDGKLSTTATVSVQVTTLQVSLRSAVRDAYAQDAQSKPLSVNGRAFNQDVLDTAEFADLVAAGVVANNE